MKISSSASSRLQIPEIGYQKDFVHMEDLQNLKPKIEHAGRSAMAKGRQSKNRFDAGNTPVPELVGA